MDSGLKLGLSSSIERICAELKESEMPLSDNLALQEHARRSVYPGAWEQDLVRQMQGPAPVTGLIGWGIRSNPS